MYPKSHKDFKKGIAEEVGVHEQVVDDFISFYYSKVRKSLSDISFPRVYVEGLGTFGLRINKLENAILKNKSLLGNIAKRTYNGYAKSEDVSKKIRQMEIAMDQIQKDIKEKKKFRNER